MVYRVLLTMKRFALALALKFMPKTDVDVEAPEPRIRTIDGIKSAGLADGWLFEAPASPVSPAVDALSGELDRLSDRMSGLRALLADIAEEAPADNELDVFVSPVPEARDAMVDSDLFEIAPDVVFADETIDADAYSFLFEDAAEEQPASWSILGDPAEEPRRAA